MNKNLSGIGSFKESLKYDLTSGLVVFLVAVPLCLGIALASGAPLFSGLIAGIVGGIIIGSISNSHLSVSGPAAGLTIIVLDAIATLGSFEVFLCAVFLAGIIQIAMGYAKAGSLAAFFPSAVIKGMLAAIGVILILKQIPHAVGYDKDYEGDLSFLQLDNENTISEIFNAFSAITPGAVIVSVISLLIMIYWGKIKLSFIKAVPAPLVVVVAGILINLLFAATGMVNLVLEPEHLVQIPVAGSFGELVSFFTIPDFTNFSNPKVYLVAVTLALVATLETLLNVEAIDRIDPYKRNSPKNRELKAQGIGNMVSGLIGGLPITSVIVRSSVAVNSGGRTKVTTIFHGFLILIAIALFPQLLNLIPYASLAGILLITGYKLTNVALYKNFYKQGWDQFLPFVITVLAIVFTDLLVGILIGMGVSIFFILKRNMKNNFSYLLEEQIDNHKVKITLSEEVSFLNKASLQDTLDELPANSEVIIDASNSKFIDFDVLEVIEEFKKQAEIKQIKVRVINLKESYVMREKPPIVNEYHAPEYEQLFVNNRKWVENMLDKDSTYFEKMARGQSPKYLFIGCSDSRVPANEITQTDPGEMFVHRNIANLVVHTDMNVASVLQYSVEVLKVKHIIVCGHYGCGGVRAAVDGKDHGLIDKWLRNIKDVYRLHKNELDAIYDEEQRHRKLVELNVREQVYHLCMTAVVQNAMRDRGLKVHGWVYEMGQGYIKDLHIDLENEFKDYGLYKFYEKLPVE